MFSFLFACLFLAVITDFMFYKTTLAECQTKEKAVGGCAHTDNQHWELKMKRFLTATPQLLGQGGEGIRLHPSPVQPHTLQPLSWAGWLDKVRIVCQQAVMSGMLRAPEPPPPRTMCERPSSFVLPLHVVTVSVCICADISPQDLFIIDNSVVSECVF